MSARRKKRRVAVRFPAELLRRLDSAAARLSLDRSKLIRSAVEEFLRARHKFEQELAEGYQANAELDRQICAEFK